MRYKAISLAVAILLLATPVFAQDISPILVETGTATPTTVITGQPFSQTYIVRFIDLADQKEEIIVQEGGLKPGLLGNFEVLKLDSVKLTPPPKQFREHRWHLTYTLRIVNPQKGPYIIPPLIIPWILKKVGQDPSDPTLKVNTDFKTNPVHINYVTTIPVKDPNLYIRDEINFGDFSSRAFNLRVSSWLIGTLPLLLFVRFVVRNFKSSRKPQVSESSIDVSEAEDVSLSALVAVSRRQALRKLKSVLRNFDKLRPDNAKDADLYALEVSLSEALNSFLRVELSLNIGSTPADMASYTSQQLKEGRYKKLFVDLTKIAVFYQQDAEKGHIDSAVRFVQQTHGLKELLKNMSWHSRFFSYIKRG